MTKQIAEFIRAMVRPVVTFAFVGASIYLVVPTANALGQVPEWCCRRGGR